MIFLYVYCIFCIGKGIYMKNYLVVSLFKIKCPNYTLRHYCEEILYKTMYLRIAGRQ